MGKRSLVLSTGVAALAALPFSVFAAETDFFGPIIPGPGNICYCPGRAMDWGCALQIFQNVLNVVVSLGVIAVVFFIAWAGFMLMTGGSNPATRQKAKNRMLNAVVGLVLIFGGVTFVDTVMKVIYNPSTAFEGGTFGPWNGLLKPGANTYCLKKNDNPGILNSGSLVDIVDDIVNPGNGSSSGGTSAGTCQVKSSGPCATSNFTAAFGSAASQASQICSAESANGTLLQGDRTTSGKPVSFGLFQINITAHPVAGLQCPKAFDSQFTGSHKNVAIINQSLYQQCKSAALNSSNNAAVAASIFKGDRNSWRQWSTRRKCGLP